MKFQTVSQVTKSEGVSMYKLRHMIKSGECPGFYSGSRFYINVERLREILDKSTSQDRRAR